MELIKRKEYYIGFILNSVHKHSSVNIDIEHFRYVGLRTKDKYIQFELFKIIPEEKGMDNDYSIRKHLIQSKCNFYEVFGIGWGWYIAIGEDKKKVEVKAKALKTNFTPSTPGATTATCGAIGSVTIGSTSNEIQNWVFNWTVDAIDVTSMNSDSWGENIGCLQGGNGTFESFVPFVTLGLQTSAVFNDGSSIFNSDVIIKSIKTTVDVNGAVKFVYGFDATGEVS